MLLTEADRTSTSGRITHYFPIEGSVNNVTGLPVVDTNHGKRDSGDHYAALTNSISRMDAVGKLTYNDNGKGR